MSTGISLAKIIENRSKCYWQLSDLKGLKSQCLLTEEDYVHEKKKCYYAVIKET